MATHSSALYFLQSSTFSFLQTQSPSGHPGNPGDWAGISLLDNFSEWTPARPETTCSLSSLPTQFTTCKWYLNQCRRHHLNYLVYGQMNWVVLCGVKRALKCIINWGQIIFATVTKETSIAIVTAYVKLESYDSTSSQSHGQKTRSQGREIFQSIFNFSFFAIPCQNIMKCWGSLKEGYF